MAHSIVEDALNQLRSVPFGALAILESVDFTADPAVQRRLGKIRRSALSIIEEVDEIKARNAMAAAE